MCKVRDIVIIDGYISNGVPVGKHPFVIIDDEKDEIHGFDFDFIANAMSSFKDAKQRARKLSYAGTFPIGLNDKVTNPDNRRDGFVSADQLYYFKKDRINYQVIGEMKEEKFNQLIEFITTLEIDDITDNIE